MLVFYRGVPTVTVAGVLAPASTAETDYGGARLLVPKLVVLEAGVADQRVDRDQVRVWGLPCGISHVRGRRTEH